MKIEFYNVKKGLIRFACLILLLGWFVYDRFQYKNTMSWSFKGEVENVKYGFLRSTPIINVNNNEYDLWRTKWDTHLKIQVGDTIVKRKGTLNIFLIRRGTRDTLND